MLKQPNKFQALLAPQQNSSLLDNFIHLSLAAVFLALLAPAEIIASAQECTSCHNSSFNQPTSTFQSGLGKWKDEQCTGCHSEINKIAKQFDSKNPSRLSQMIPLSFQKLARLKNHPLSYTQALAHPLQQDENRQKYDPWELYKFVLRPTSDRPVMPAYPNLSVAEFSKIFGLQKTNTKPENSDLKVRIVLKGAKLFRSKGCVNCHSSNGQGPRELGLSRFNATYIKAYATGETKENKLAVDRMMPDIPLLTEDAEAIHSWLTSERVRVEQNVDTTVAKLSPLADRLTETEELALSKFLFSGSFVRDAACVHCHSTLPRAKAIFEGTGKSLMIYIKSGGAKTFWERLATRAVEEEHGIVSSKPGMPMASRAVDKSLLDAVGKWVRHGCRISKQELLCKNQIL